MARLIGALEQILDDAGNPIADALIDFFESGSTSIRKSTFADADETIENENPLKVNPDGRVPNVFGTGSYNIIVRYSGGQIAQRDPVGGDQSSVFGSDWVPDTSYNVNDVVRDTNQYWISLSSSNSGNKPSIDGGVNWILYSSSISSESEETIAIYAAMDGRMQGGGTANAYTANAFLPRINPPARLSGMRITFDAVANNVSGLSTLQVFGLPASPIKLSDGVTDVPANAIVSGEDVTVIDRISYFEFVSTNFLISSAIDEYSDLAIGRLNLRLANNFPPNEFPVMVSQEISRSTYSKLWDYVQSSGNLSPTPNDAQWGSGDGSTTFNTPSLGGYHLRLLDGGNGIDMGRSLGSIQLDEIKSHTHTTGATGSSYISDVAGGGGRTHPVNVGGSVTGSTGSPENRVINIPVLITVTFE